MSYRVSISPIIEPLTVDEVKTWLKVDGTSENDLLALLITASREFVEEYSWRSILTQTIEEVYDSFPLVTKSNPLGCLELNRNPVQSISSITYTDENGDGQTWDDSNYVLDNITIPSRVVTSSGVSYPSTESTVNAIKVTYITGNTVAADVPGHIRLAMLKMIGDMYENRVDSVKKLPNSSEYLLSVSRFNRF